MAVGAENSLVPRRDHLYFRKDTAIIAVSADTAQVKVGKKFQHIIYFSLTVSQMDKESGLLTVLLNDVVKLPKPTMSVRYNNDAHSVFPFGEVSDYFITACFPS